jgi:membrane-associated phospholipid phosphatase
MHVAVAVWLCLVFRHWTALTFAAIICVGAVTLGWHYSLDVPAGIAVAYAGWAMAKLVIKLMPTRTINSLKSPYFGLRRPSSRTLR